MLFVVSHSDKMNKLVLDKIGSVLMNIEKEYGGEQDELLWPHHPEKNSIEKD